MSAFKTKFAKALALILPGIFLFGFNIGTGSVTAMAKAGATYGMSLLWTILASCFTTYFLINLYGKYTLATGETALQAFNSIILPVTVGCILYLGNRRDLMGEHKNSMGSNIFLIAVLIFSIFTSTMGIKGLWQLIAN